MALEAPRLGTGLVETREQAPGDLAALTSPFRFLRSKLGIDTCYGH